MTSRTITRDVSRDLTRPVVGRGGNQNSPAIIGDWPNWDGSEDGATTNILTRGNINGHHNLISVDGTKALLAYNDATAAEARMMFITNDALTPSEGTEVTLSGSDATGFSGVKMSDTRALIFSEDYPSDDQTAYLIDISGSDPSEVDSITDTSQNVALIGEADKMDDDYAVVCGRKASNKCHVQFYSITGDTLAYGASLQLYTDAQYGASCCAINSTQAIVVGAYRAFLVDRDGLTASETDNILVTDPQVYNSVVSVHRVSDTQALVFYYCNDPVDGRGYYCKALTVTGGDTLVWGDKVTLATTALSFNGNIDFVTQIADKYFFVAIWENAEVFGQVVEYNGTGTPTVHTTAKTVFISTTGDQRDQVVVTTLDNETVMLAYQIDNGTPAQQVGCRVIKASVAG